MAYSINRQPLLREISDSEFDDEIENEIEDTRTAVPDAEPFIKTLIPQDRYNLAYLAFYLLGINTLISWCFFITADDYWMYKFRDVHPNNSGQHNYSHIENIGPRNDLQASFTSYLSLTSSIPGPVFLIINTFISHRISLSARMIGSQGLILLLFLMTTALVRVNTDEWQSAFLIITLVTVAFVNAAGAIFTGSLMGVAGRFSPKYITAMSAGQALGGIVTALTEILSLWIGASPVISGLLYFTIGDIILFASLIVYVILEKAVFFKYHMLNTAHKSVDNSLRVQEEVSFSNKYVISYSRIFKKIWPYGLSMFILFCVTMMVYPAVTVLVESQNKGKGHVWNDVYFVPVITYLTFSTADYLGRLICGKLLWVCRKPWMLILLISLRILFVPAFIFCNAQPRHHLSVFITSDVVYIFITIFFAITNGYFCNLLFILAPTAVDVHEKEVASLMVGSFLSLGVCIGSAISILIVKLL